jgi:hypothetical protein
MGRDPDLVFVNAGLHEALVTPGPRDLEEYEVSLSVLPHFTPAFV